VAFHRWLTLTPLDHLRQSKTLDLSRWALWQIIHDLDDLGHLEFTEVFAAMRLQLFGGAFAIRFEHAATQDLFTVMFIRDTHGRSI
jgi:hypothetical protein